MLLSHKEMKAKAVELNHHRTVIYGKNDTGKSSLIKSIYEAFGANPRKSNPKWVNLSPIILVKFLVDEIRYTIVKDYKTFAVFDANDKMLGLFNSVTKELGPFLAELFDFQIQLPDQNNNIITPPPAYCFLPFYIDQDSSWQEPWVSFRNLSQIKKYKDPISYYHTGIRPNEYYITKGEIDQHLVTIKELESEKKLAQNMLKKVKDQLEQVDFSFNMDDFKEEIKELLVESQILKKAQERLKNKLVEFHNMKTNCETQIEITKKALNEVRKDYQHATFYQISDHIDCPTCGAVYENSFEERFEIAQDENKCKELLVELSRELTEINTHIQATNQAYTNNNEEIIRVETILEKKRGEVKLRDIIENEGKRELKKVFDENINSLKDEIFELTYQINLLNEKLKSIENKERKNEILDYYRRNVRTHLRDLDVWSISEEDMKNINTTIPETGSTLPRALMSYYFSILKTINKYGTSTFCPIIIDSPNQQAQDIGHIDLIYNFILDNQPENSQMVMGVEELYDIDFNCPIIELKEKYSLLQSEEYEEVDTFMQPYLDKMYNNSKLF
jgi:predicted  nucleic acid-binding Zn-ribbon protein